MPCGSCSKKNSNRRNIRNKKDYMKGYKTMQPSQAKARLEKFKKNYCGDCDQRYDCNLHMYLKCTKKDN